MIAKERIQEAIQVTHEILQLVTRKSRVRSDSKLIKVARRYLRDDSISTRDVQDAFDLGKGFLDLIFRAAFLKE